MPKGLLSMRQIKEVLRLSWNLDRSQRYIAQSTGISRSTVRDYLRRARAANLGWPLPEDITEEHLHQLLYPPVERTEARSRPLPSWSTIHQELKRKGVTLNLLWEEYKREHPNGLQYSRFAQQYRQWRKGLEVWMIQTHKAGDKAFVDYSGLTVPIWNARCTEILYHAEIFVACLGASDLIFCVATKTQQLPDWIHAHCLMFEFFEGAPLALVPDNLRSAVTKANRYEPLCHRTYEDCAAHYHSSVMPARSYSPKDKSKAEKSVQFAQQRILAPLRDTRFNALDRLNESIAHRVMDVNDRHFQKLPYSRRELFERIERKALQPLPSTRYTFGQWFSETLNGSYHVCIHLHHYSVPYTYVGKKIETHVTARTVECFCRNQRIASHQRNDTPSEHSTLDEHRPEAHRQQALWKSDRLLKWAEQIGLHTYQLINQVLTQKRRHLQQKERSALGILRLSHRNSEPDLEEACAYALSIGTIRYDSILSILKRGLAQSVVGDDETGCGSQHANVRGADYYQ